MHFLEVKALVLIKIIKFSKVIIGHNMGKNWDERT